MMNFEQIKTLLSSEVITISEQPITLGDLLMIPLLLVVGILMTKWGVKLITNRLTNKKTDPNVIHLLQRILYLSLIHI